MTVSAVEIEEKFIALFQINPQLFYAPGRINLIGEHIDYNDGFVMPAAIDKGIWYAVAPNNTNDVHVYSADMNEHLHVSLQDIKKSEGWKNYILGILDQFVKHKYPISGFNIVFGGNLPVGAGLSSSAAVECGLAFALNTIFNLNISKIDLTLLCQKAGHTFPGVQCGIMDMFASMMGEKDKVLLLDCNSLKYETLPFDSTDYSIVLINSKVHHSLASGEYNKRRQQCEEGLAILKSQLHGVNSFRDISSKSLLGFKTLLGEEIYMRCLYVTEEIERTQLGASLLKEKNITAFGKLMYQTHEGLSNLYNVSCTELDFLVNEAKKYPEIIGARQMGGGFGGCTINIIQKNEVENITSEITKAYKQNLGINAEVYVMSLADGTHALYE